MEKVTIYTLAKELGVSPSAVSRAFNPNARLSAEKRTLILEAARKHGYVQNKLASRLSQNPIHIGVLMHGRIETYYSCLLDGIRAAQNVYQNYKVTCDIRELHRGNPHVPDACAVTEACTVLDEFRAARCDGVIVQGLFQQEIVEKINELTECGISVVTLHNDLPASTRLFTSTINTDVTAQMVAQLFDIMLPGSQRDIVVFSGSMQSFIHQNLIQAFISKAADYGIRVLRHYDTMDIPELAGTQAEEVFSCGRRIDGVYVSSSNSIPICRCLEEHGLTDTVVIASDVFDALNPFIEHGTVNATIFQDPYAQGYSAFEKLYCHLAENQPVNEQITVSPQIVLKSNLALYCGAITKNLSEDQ